MEAEEEDDYPDIDPTLNPMSEFDDNIMHMDEIFPTGQWTSVKFTYFTSSKVGLNIVYVKTNYVTNEVICNGLSINMFTISYAVNFDCYRKW